MEPQAGDVLDGKYRLLHRIGQGAMATVYAAEHMVLRQQVAVKILLPSYDADPTVRERFAIEARAASRIGGEFVAQIFDVGTSPDGSPFIVMEKLDGETLAERRSRVGRLSVTTIADFLLQTMEALARAHSLGIVHRDVKPDNLFIAKSRDQRETIKLLDFGMARVRDNAEHSLTAAGTVLGSLSYMSPEHCRGGKFVVPQSDVWSLAVTAFELTSGELPFQADHPIALFTKIGREDAPRLVDVVPDVDAAWSAVIATGLARDLAVRYASVLEFAQAVGPFATPEAETSLVARIEGTLTEKTALHRRSDFDEDTGVVSGIADTMLADVSDLSDSVPGDAFDTQTAPVVRDLRHHPHVTEPGMNESVTTRQGSSHFDDDSTEPPERTERTKRMVSSVPPPSRAPSSPPPTSVPPGAPVTPRGANGPSQRPAGPPQASPPADGEQARTGVRNPIVVGVGMVAVVAGVALGVVFFRAMSGSAADLGIDASARVDGDAGAADAAVAVDGATSTSTSAHPRPTHPVVRPAHPTSPHPNGRPIPR